MSNAWKKIVMPALAAALIVLSAGGSAFAAGGDVIGVIDSQLIVTRHPSFETTARQLQQTMVQKENEARIAAEQEPDQARRAQIVQTKRMEAVREEQRLMEPIYRDCQEAVRVIARQRNVTIVLEKSSVYFGGEDITDYVIQQLSRR